MRLRMALALGCAAGACTAPVYPDHEPAHRRGADAAIGPPAPGALGLDGEAPDHPAFCGDPIDAVVEVVDELGAPFTRDLAGTFRVPIGTLSFGFDARRSSPVTGHDMSHTFRSGCYPTVTVKAPVLLGLTTEGFWLEKRCHFSVEIADAGCAEVRRGRAEGSFVIIR